MYITETEIGKFNITIKGTQLNHETNKWFYLLQIDKFNKDNNWEDSNNLYIEGYEDGNGEQKYIMDNLVQSWINFVTEEEVEKMFGFKKHSRFKINRPMISALV